jgi:hypothetical protein
MKKISIETVKMVKSIKPGESIEVPANDDYAEISDLCSAFKGLSCVDHGEYYTISRRDIIRRDSVWNGIKPILGKFLLEPINEIRVFDSMHRVRKCVVRFNRENGINLRVRVVYGKSNECVVYCSKWERLVLTEIELNEMIQDLKNRKIKIDELI